MSASAIVSAEIRAELARQRHSSLALAEHLGISRSTLSRRLSGQAPWEIDEVVAAAAWLGLPVERLLPDSAVA